MRFAARQTSISGITRVKLLGCDLAAQGDHNGEAVWRRTTDAVGQLANESPPGPLH
jgi:hypothetical protein